MEALIGLLCFGSIIVIGTLVVLLAGMRSDLAALRRRTDRLEATLYPLPSAAAPSVPVPALPDATAAVAVAQTLGDKPQTLPPSGVQAAAAEPAARGAQAAAKPRWYEDNPILDWFLRRHLLVQLGLVVLFIGVAFLLSYAIDQGWISIEARHVAVAVGALAMGGMGWWLRARRRTFGLALQGGALAILYLTTFSAYRMYELLPAPVAFGVFFGLGAVGCLLAILNDAAILAFLATAGAFAAPLLTGDNGGSYGILFGYYALLNGGVLAIAFFKAWYGLNLVSFLATYGVGLWFTMTRYTVADYGGMQAFVAFFFVLYIAIVVLFTLRRAPAALGRVSVLLAFGNPLLALTWQALIAEPIDHGLGYGAVAGGAIYGVLAAILFARRVDALADLREIFLFLGLFLGTFAVPLFWSGRVTAAVWAVTGAAWVGWGERRRSRWLPAWGALVQLGAGAAFVLYIFDNDWTRRASELYAGPAFVSPFLIGALILALAGIASAYVVHRTHAAGAAPAVARGGAEPFAAILLTWGLLWWFGGGALQIAATAERGYWVSGLVAFLALSCAAGEWLGVRLAWPGLRVPMLLLLPVLFLLALAQVQEIQRPLEGGAWYAWPLALVALYWMLWRRDGERHMAAYHAGALWLITYLGVMAVQGFVWNWERNVTLAAAAILFVLAVVIWAAVWLGPRLPKPIGSNAAAYQTWGAGPVTAIALLYLLYASTFSTGDLFPLPYLPVLNPFDLATITLLAATLYWLAETRALVPPAGRRVFWALRWGWGLVMVYCLTTGLARAVHQLTDVPFAFDELYASALLQTLISIAWGGLALVLMFAARFRRARSLWFAGAIVLVVTLIKLFAVDLASVGTIARIVSFIGVGLLIIVIAFFAPVPPRQPAAEPADLHAADL